MRQKVGSEFFKANRFQSTHPVGGATRCNSVRRRPETFQSTHPVGGATRWMLGYIRTLSISIHAPRGGCDSVRWDHYTVRWIFQSTHPVGGATREEHLSLGTLPFQSTHPSRGATLMGEAMSQLRPISIHAPLTGCDRRCPNRAPRTAISIHAPLTGCDFGRHGPAG